MYISPLTPSGTILILSSNTLTLAPFSFLPIPTLPPPPSPLFTSSKLVNTVVSVGPYSCTSFPTPPLFTTSFAHLSLRLSPPTTTTLTPLKQSASSLANCSNNADVRYITLTPFPSISLLSSFALSATSLFINSTRPPQT